MVLSISIPYGIRRPLGTRVLTMTPMIKVKMRAFHFVTPTMCMIHNHDTNDKGEVVKENHIYLQSSVESMIVHVIMFGSYLFVLQSKNCLPFGSCG